MVPLVIAVLVAGSSFFFVWLLGFSQEEAEKIEDITKNHNVVVVTEEEAEAKEVSPNALINLTINKESKEDFHYAQLWSYQVKSRQNFRWPQEAATLVDIQKKREGATQLSSEMRLKLKGMGILREQTGEPEAIENIAEIARDTGILMPRKNLWVTFDCFSSKRRPGLAQSSEDDEDGGSPKVIANKEKKKRKLEETAAQNVKIIEWKNKHTDLFQQEKQNLIRFVRMEKQGFVRAF
eukprot:GFUD01005820.1.p1 GENE.GFUD01005820.1~~GFUD01005820.1.p1  ORF type:complete len:237 (+),score=58.05 GFUD01005820.1:90-800(+)